MRKTVGSQLLPDHEATALVRSMMRENLMRSLYGFLEKNPGHPNAIRLTDPVRWEARFGEIIEGLSPEVKECTRSMFKCFVQYWNDLSEPERVVAAAEIARHIIAGRILMNVQKNDPNFFLPGTITLQ